MKVNASSFQLCIYSIFQVIGLQQLRPKDPHAEPSTLCKMTNKFLWLLGISRNAICVVICGFIGYRFSSEGESPFQIIGHVPQGLPEVKLPPFGCIDTVNGTEINHTFVEMVEHIGSGVVVVALIALLENIAVCKAFCKYNY